MCYLLFSRFTKTLMIGPTQNPNKNIHLSSNFFTFYVAFWSKIQQSLNFCLLTYKWEEVKDLITQIVIASCDKDWLLNQHDPKYKILVNLNTIHADFTVRSLSKQAMIFDHNWTFSLFILDVGTCAFNEK